MNPLSAVGRMTEFAGRRLANAYRRTGADLPFGDPLPSHACEMEGWFWRVTDAASGRVVVALFSVNRHPDGDWSTAAVALHPGDVVRAAALNEANAENSPFELTAGSTTDSTFYATVDDLRVDLDEVKVRLRCADSVGWPNALGGGGIASSVPSQPVLAPAPPRRNSKWHCCSASSVGIWTMRRFTPSGIGAPDSPTAGGGVRRMTSAMPTCR